MQPAIIVEGQLVNKTTGKPVAKTQDFLDAVRESDLSDAAKAAWVHAVAEEGTSGEKR